MMGICGVYCDSFDDANLACVVDISTNANYPHLSFDVVSVDQDDVILKSHANGKHMTFKRQHGNGQDCLVIKMKSSYETMLGRPAKKFKILPFNGKRT